MFTDSTWRRLLRASVITLALVLGVPGLPVPLQSANLQTMPVAHAGTPTLPFETGNGPNEECEKYVDDDYVGFKLNAGHLPEVDNGELSYADDDTDFEVSIENVDGNEGRQSFDLEIVDLGDFVEVRVLVFAGGDFEEYDLDETDEDLDAPDDKAIGHILFCALDD